eukprot:TRINITY_DN78_c0_g1_i6.p1 TRINITY_DN78_c0_g1~~TRINITY_DN78_c0_g1_i6.p1  ORF type:complete len:134 (+),score=37.60 TRINITY_DN78_c0_g1_i6:79-480(+)
MAVRSVAVCVFAAFSLAAGTKLNGGASFVALDKDMKTKMVVQAEAHQGPCEGITCGNLQCPTGFVPTTVEGHCCPYCINPNLKVEAEITGATGKAGGKQSSFCADVWCFPTMCEGEEVAPTTGNGQCCAECPK